VLSALSRAIELQAAIRGCCFRLVLIAASQWQVFFTAAAVAAAMAAAVVARLRQRKAGRPSCTGCRCSRRRPDRGRAYWGKMQSIFALVRFFGGSERLAWVFQWIMTASVAVALVLLWRSRIRYSLKAAALAVGTLLVTPYLFLYDLLCWRSRSPSWCGSGSATVSAAYELPALGLIAFLLMFYPLLAAPTALPRR